MAEQRTSKTAKAEISVSGKEFTSIDVDCLCKNFPQIANLTIYNTGLTEIPFGLDKLKNLKELEFRSDTPDKIVGYSNLCQMKNLETLFLSDSFLTNFPQEICGLTNLKSLSIVHSKLTYLPYEISKLTNLVNLDLNNNNLRSLN